MRRHPARLHRGLEVLDGGLFDIERIARGRAAVPLRRQAGPGDEWSANRGGTQQGGIAQKRSAVDLVASLRHRSDAFMRIHHGSTEYTESTRKNGSETITHSFCFSSVFFRV